jgi:hypothetical protein
VVDVAGRTEYQTTPRRTVGLSGFVFLSQAHERRIQAPVSFCKLKSNRENLRRDITDMIHRAVTIESLGLGPKLLRSAAFLDLGLSLPSSVKTASHRTVIHDRVYQAGRERKPFRRCVALRFLRP